MGIFGKLFSRKREEKTLERSRLKDWLIENQSKEIKQVNHQVKEKFGELRELKKSMIGSLSTLAEASLINNNIPEREKHIMLGNRFNYIKKVNSFLDEIKISEYDYKSIEEFCAKFASDLASLNVETAKGYFVLKNFFDKEISSVALQIKEMDEVVLQISRLLKDEAITDYRQINTKISELSQSYDEAAAIGKELEELTEENTRLEMKKQQFQERSKALTRSPEYSEFHDADRRLKSIDERIDELGNQLNNAIKPLDKQLKKLMHDEFREDIIRSYLENPLKTLGDDTSMELLEIAERAKWHSEDLSEKERTKLERSVALITPEFLTGIRKEHRELESTKRELLAKKEKQSVMMDFMEIEYQMDHLNEKIRKNHEELSSRRKKLESMDIDSMKEELESLLSDFSGMNISIN